MNPLTDALINAIRNAGMKFIIAGDSGNLHKRLQHDGKIPAGSEMGPAIRNLQSDGAVVAAIARDGTNRLIAADVAINIAKPSGRPSWGGDLLCGPDLEEAVLIIKACEVAANVSRRSVQLAAGGTGLGILSALMAYKNNTPSQSHTMVNSAALSAITYGTWKGIELDRSPRAVAIDTTPWHEFETDQIFRKLETKAAGLSDNQVKFRLRATKGEEVNTLSALEPYIAELANPLNPVLGVGAALSLLTGSRVDAAMVAGFIGINTLIGGTQQLYTERKLKQILSETTGNVRVVRNGTEIEIPDDKLVEGDVIRLAPYETVPADCRIIEATNLEVDESNISGEALPVGKNSGPCWQDSVTESTNMLYEDSTIVAGEVTAVVVATGLQTHISRIMTEAGPIMSVTGSGVEMRLRELTARVMPVAGAAGIASLVAGAINGWTGRELLSTGVSLAIASVPEGLPFISTASQLASLRRLSAYNAVVRNPRKIEVLGRVDVLCFDKTGTLTQGRIELERLGDAHSHRSLNKLTDRDSEMVAHALRATGINGNGNGEGNVMDQSIIKAAEAIGIDKLHNLQKWNPIDEIPFEASRGMHAVVAETSNGRLLSVKGAPEKVLEKCSFIYDSQGSYKISEESREKAFETMSSLMKQGYRVLAVARKVISTNNDSNIDESGSLEFIGFMGFSDPVRDTAIEAVDNVRKAGVKVVMITGDHPNTAESIARQLNILQPIDLAKGAAPEENRILTGEELARLSNDELDAIIEQVAVYARVTPRQKVRVVKSLQRQGRIVAMTGDGANDAPAIRLADMGVAMGKRGTKAAREAADMVVTDDRLETISIALIEGRALWGSVREAIGIVVGGNLGEISSTAITSFFSSQPPMNARQFLLVNLFTDLLPALAIAVRPPATKTPEMLQLEGPEASLGTALSNKITQRAVFTTVGATSAWALARLTGTHTRANTVGLLGLVGSQLGQTLVAGGTNNPLVLASVAGSAVGLFAIVQTPGLSQFFGCRPIGPAGWGIAATTSVLATGGSVIASKYLDERDRNN
ncbi:MAG: cation-transporting P-type ATPase [Balneolales bacterium]|nr:cation-transporting P-type ATPase [Balneolales bacterium]